MFSSPFQSFRAPRDCFLFYVMKSEIETGLFSLAMASESSFISSLTVHDTELYKMKQWTKIRSCMISLLFASGLHVNISFSLVSMQFHSLPAS